MSDDRPSGYYQVLTTWTPAGVGMTPSTSIDKVYWNNELKEFFGSETSTKRFGYGYRHVIKPLMTAREIIDRLKAEEITCEMFIHGHERPNWLGVVHNVQYDHFPQTTDELEHIKVAYHFPEHGVYLRTMGTMEEDEKEWDYWEGFSECRPVTTTHTITEYI